MQLVWRNKRGIVLLLALSLCFSQLLPVQGRNNGQSVHAEEVTSGPEDTSSVPTTGGAVTTEPSLELTEFDISEQTTSSISLLWEALPNATIYYIYCYNTATGQYEYIGSTASTSYILSGLPAGQSYFFTIRAYNEYYNLMGECADPIEGYTRPEKLADFSFTGNTADSISLAWSPVASATGYLIYRAGLNGTFKKVAATTELQYTDSGLTSGKTYRYKILTYGVSADNTGEESVTLNMTTLTAAPVIKVKGGTKKIRVSWAAVKGASGYNVYTEQNGEYVLLTTLSGKSNKSYVQTNLKNGTEYKYRVTAYRTLDATSYESEASAVKKGKPSKSSKTSTKAKLFRKKADFKKSDAYQNIKFFKKKVKYGKSITLPGMINTNVSGFTSYSMIPQGLTYAKSYFFVTAYDGAGEENSVIYVIKKSSKKLVTTIVLPNKAHAGGIAFDGKNLWITQAKTLRSIPYKEISGAIKAKKSYYEVKEYATINTLNQQAAAVTYYKGLLWVASYDELKAGYMGSYQIVSKDSAPSLVECNMIEIPTRVQGIAFTSNGRLIFSRSCQTDSSKRGFLHQLDVYKPNLKKASQGIITLGKLRNYFEMPTMNEEITVCGNYLYVNFESAYFGSAVNRMDRICAFPLKAVTKLLKE